jgi:hypothetical protein
MVDHSNARQTAFEVGDTGLTTSEKMTSTRHYTDCLTR